MQPETWTWMIKGIHGEGGKVLERNPRGTFHKINNSFPYRLIFSRFSTMLVPDWILAGPKRKADRHLSPPLALRSACLIKRLIFKHSWALRSSTSSRKLPRVLVNHRWAGLVVARVTQLITVCRLLCHSSAEQWLACKLCLHGLAIAVSTASSWACIIQARWWYVLTCKTPIDYHPSINGKVIPPCDCYVNCFHNI